MPSDLAAKRRELDEIEERFRAANEDAAIASPRPWDVDRARWAYLFALLEAAIDGTNRSAPVERLIAACTWLEQARGIGGVEIVRAIDGVRDALRDVEAEG